MRHGRGLQILGRLETGGCAQIDWPVKQAERFACRVNFSMEHFVTPLTKPMRCRMDDASEHKPLEVRARIRLSSGHDR
jgi:hypothetical protein